MQSKSAKPNYFGPRDNFSKNLLLSVPKKIITWLDNLGQLAEPEGALDGLTWSLKNSNATSILQITDDKGTFTLLWNGSFKKIDRVRGTEQWLENISKNLDKFVELEQRIYAPIEALEKKIAAEVEAEYKRTIDRGVEKYRDERNLQTPSSS